jgi:hypothetical protein
MVGGDGGGGDGGREDGRMMVVEGVIMWVMVRYRVMVWG